MTALALVLTPQQQAIRALADQDLRVATVGYRLARAAGPFVCTEQNLSTGGLVVQDAAQYSTATRDDARIVLGLGDGPTIVGVVAGAQTPLQTGDVILSVNGVRVAAGSAAAPYARFAQVEDALEAPPTNSVFEIRRGSANMKVMIVATPGCRSRFQIVRGGLGATQADGRYVQISERMMELAPTDDALAAVMAHELSHNVLRHNALKTPGKQSEYEADRLSVWLVAWAGYDLDAVLPFWTALRKRSDYGIFADGTHPGWRDRLARLAAAVAEVKAQQAARVPLIPPPQEPASQQRKAR